MRALHLPCTSRPQDAKPQAHLCDLYTVLNKSRKGTFGACASQDQRRRSEQQRERACLCALSSVSYPEKTGQGEALAVQSAVFRLPKAR